MNRNRSHRNRQREEELRNGVLENREKGWKDFLAHFSPLIHSLIRRFHLSQEDHEEVFQEVSVNLSRNQSKALRDWDPDKGSLSNYVGVITVRTVQTFLKSRFHLESLRMQSGANWPDDPQEILDLLSHPTRCVREQIYRNQIMEILRGILDDLVTRGRINEDDRRLLRLRLQGQSFREIEEFLGIPVNTQTSRFSRLKPILVAALFSVEISSFDLEKWDSSD